VDEEVEIQENRNFEFEHCCALIPLLVNIHKVITCAIETVRPRAFQLAGNLTLDSVLANANDSRGLEDPFAWQKDAAAARQALNTARLWITDLGCILGFIVAHMRWEANSAIDESWLDGVWDHPDEDVQARFNDLRASWINTPTLRRVGVLIKPFDCMWGCYTGALVISHSPMWISWGTEPRKILVTALDIPRPLRPTLDEIRDAFPPDQPSLAQHAAWMREAVTQNYLPPAAVEYDRGYMHGSVDTVYASERHVVDERATSRWDSSTTKGRADFT
jgi:hypothetical protein